MANKKGISLEELKELEEGIEDEPIVSPYKIDTGFIFSRLVNPHDNKWREYDREFLIEVVHPALKRTLKANKIISIKFNDENEKELKKYIDEIYPSALERCEDKYNFPFPEFNLVRNSQVKFKDGEIVWSDEVESKSDEVVFFDEPCKIDIDQYDFSLFFALQLSLTEFSEGSVPKLNNFLDFHFNTTFKSDFREFRSFIRSINLQYKSFLKSGYSEYIELFLEHFDISTIPVEEQEEPNPTNNPHNVETSMQKVSKKSPKNKEEEVLVNTFDYSNKEGFFMEDKLGELKKIETILLQEGFFKKQKIKKSQVALIHFLYNYRYLRIVKNRGNIRVTLLKYRRFLEKRYSINIAKAFQENQFDVGKLYLYEPEFTCFPEIELKLSRNS